MGIETAQYVGQLVAANPLSTDSVSQADDHLRLIKSALVNTFPNLTAPVTLTAAQLNSPIPKGVILLWSGATSAIPVGYALCDGTGGTPDLRNQFVVGAGSTYQVGATGGSVSTGPAGAHTHTENSGTANLSAASVTVATGAGVPAVSTVVDQGHSHTINEVGDHQHSILPPYLALAYIMKL